MYTVDTWIEIAAYKVSTLLPVLWFLVSLFYLPGNHTQWYLGLTSWLCVQESHFCWCPIIIESVYLKWKCSCDRTEIAQSCELYFCVLFFCAQDPEFNPNTFWQPYPFLVYSPEGSSAMPGSYNGLSGPQCQSQDCWKWPLRSRK